MSNEISKHDIESRQIAEKSDEYWLLNTDNGRVFPWTAYLAVKTGFVDCNKDGIPVKGYEDIKHFKNHTKARTKDLYNRLSSAGADEDTLSQVGRQLTDDANKKFALGSDRTKQAVIEQKRPSAAGTGFIIRVYKKIDQRVDAAKREIDAMVRKALNRINRRIL